MLLATALPVAAAQKGTILYLDGARFRVEAVAARGVAEVALPAGTQTGSLRIRPLGTATVSRVEVTPARPDRRAGQAIDRLAERKEALQDRLKALESREEIFLAAAKSQSGKAPRRSKANPEPVTAIRQGTEYAIGQLEEVYRVRRRVQKEVETVDARLAALRKEANVGGSLVRVWLASPGGRVAVSYVVEGAGWKPFYDFRLAGDGTALVALRVVVPPGTVLPVTVASTTLAEASADNGLPVREDFGVVETFRVPVERELYQSTPLSSLQIVGKNRTGRAFPAGEAAGFWKGEYLGHAPLPATPPEGRFDLRFGGNSLPASPSFLPRSAGQ
jgi:hypothetical protein